MRLVSIHNCDEGLILAKPIFDHNNRILLNEGSKLNSTFIQRLKRLHIPFVYVKSEVTDDVEIHDNLSSGLRFETAAKLNDVFNNLKEGKTGKNNTIGRVKSIRALSGVFDKMLKEMSASKSLLNMLTHMQSSVDELFDHSVNTSLYSLSIGKSLGLKESELHNLGLGAMFHDIGKMPLSSLAIELGVPHDDEAWKTHPEIGFELLRKEEELNLLVAHCAYQHHENMDGTGFPRGLKGTGIHVFAKIISVAESFDHLVAHKALLPHEAMEVIVGRCYTRFDSHIVEAFKNSVAIYPIGVTVELNTGETGVVIRYNKKYPQRPIIRIFKDCNGKKLAIDEFYEIDLMSVLNIMIVKCDAIIEKEVVTS